MPSSTGSSISGLPVILYRARQVEGRASRALALACVRDYAGRFGLPRPEALEQLASGKPVVAGGGLQLTVSHSGALWGCAVHTEPLGLDIQQETPGRRASAVAARWFTGEEQAYLADEPGAFYRLWCAKEAWVKCTGQGIARGFRGVSVVSRGALRTSLEGRCLTWLDFGPGVTACLWHGCGAAIEEGRL